MIDERIARTDNAWGYLYASIKSDEIPIGRHLDYGAHDGSLINILANDGLVSSAVGLELSSAAIAKAKNLNKNIELIKIESRPKIAGKYGLFNSASIIGVLEHIVDQDYILQELHGSLEDNGFLLVAVPGQHLFSFLDMGNWKFVFPFLHKLVFERRLGKEMYHRIYVDNPEGLIGDVEKAKGWHQHFSKKELSDIVVRNGFEIVKLDGAGYFYRLLWNIRYFLPKPLKRPFDYLIKLDMSLFSSAELWILAKKIR